MSHRTTVSIPSLLPQPRAVRSALADLTHRLSSSPMPCYRRFGQRDISLMRTHFSLKTQPLVAGLSTGVDAPVSKPLSAPKLPKAFQPVDLTSAALIEEIRHVVEDLTGQFEHTRRVTRGSYSEVHIIHWRCHTQPNLIGW